MENRSELTSDPDGPYLDVGEPFDVGGHPGMYPGDPNLPPEERYNCRCSLEVVVGREKLEPSVAKKDLNRPWQDVELDYASSDELRNYARFEAEQWKRAQVRNEGGKITSARTRSYSLPDRFQWSDPALSEHVCGRWCGRCAWRSNADGARRPQAPTVRARHGGGVERELDARGLRIVRQAQQLTSNQMVNVQSGRLRASISHEIRHFPTR